MLSRRVRDESVSFLEAAAEHLRDAGYSVELDADDATGELSIYVDGLEIRFVKCRMGAKPKDAQAVSRKMTATRHSRRRPEVGMASGATLAE